MTARPCLLPFIRVSIYLRQSIHLALAVCLHRALSVLAADASVINRYQLLKSLNPNIELVVEMMLPSSMTYLAPRTPVRGVDHRYLHLLAPAYIAGSGEHSNWTVGIFK